MFHSDNNEQENNMVSSKQISDAFGKVHRDVMRTIKTEIVGLGDFGSANFTKSTYISKQNKELDCYYMTISGVSWLVMGLTGHEAQQWKIKYIELLNAMEELKKHEELAMVANK